MKYNTNKECMDALTEHFLEADPKVVARAFANLILDFHRLHIVDKLPDEERENLFDRIRKNEEQFLDFYTNGPKTPFTTIHQTKVPEYDH